MMQVTGIMLPLLKFYYSEEVRQAAIQCLPELLASAHEAATKVRSEYLLCIIIYCQLLILYIYGLLELHCEGMST